MYLAGALTEVHDSGDMIRCRVADPTGAFDVVTGGRSTAIAETFRKIPVPSFVSLTGQAQIYLKNHDVSLSVRPEYVRLIDRPTRDQITLGTAESTLGRLEKMYLALEGQCTDALVIGAYRHYAVTAAGLEDLLLMVEGAVRSTGPAAGVNPPQNRPDARALVLELMQAQSGPRGLAVEEIIGTASLRGLPRDAVLSAIESLIVEDECYQPQKGFVKRL